MSASKKDNIRAIPLSSRIVVPLRPEVVRLLGHDFATAVYLEQLLYYYTHEPIEDGYFAKTKAEIEKDTALTRYQQDRARKKLVALRFLKVRVGSSGFSPVLLFKPRVKFLPPK